MFKRKAPAWVRAGQIAVGTALVVGLGTASGCLERNLGPVGPRSTAFINEKLTQSKVDKIDLVLAIDNSRSMADKQEILALAIPDLVNGLVNPGCFDINSGNFHSTPKSPLDPCPDGTQREFDPVLDIHIGVITSSLGGHGADSCPSNVAGKESNNDKGRLIARIDAAMPGELETYQNQKFLAWDPSQKLQPPGEADLYVDGDGVVEGKTGPDPNMKALLPVLRDMVRGAGQIGCGYEAQLESWYRFLIDPTPPEKVSLDSSKNVLLEGIDQTLLAQRKNFLRPDSLLAVVILTDENDCSIKESKQFYYAAQTKGQNGGPFYLPKARAICEQDPNNECCFSCGQKGPTDKDGNPTCPADPSCKTADGKDAYHDAQTDNINLRCWDQKRRYGIDFLYPISRYVDALKQQTVTDRAGQVVPNPIFSDLDQSDNNNTIRTSNLVFVAGIVGVPWQDIARTNNNGVPDLLNGKDFEGNPRGGFKNTDEMAQLLPGKDYTTWDLILGDPSRYPAAEALPKDPLMIEHYAPRSGSNPITGDPLVTSANPLGNKINGHEWTIGKQDDLQYSCIFPLVKVDDQGNVTPDVRDCSGSGLASCDCDSVDNDNPLCQVNPATGNPTNQVSAKAYPGIRELQFLKNIGSQGIVGSVCPAQLTNQEGKDFGYRPAIGAIIDRLKQALGGQCLSRTLNVQEDGSVLCLIIEASKTESCNCNETGRRALATEYQAATKKIEEDNPDSDFNCFCEITPLENEAKDTVTQTECEKNYNQTGYDLCACQWTPDDQAVTTGGKEVHGWCYIDATSKVGNPSLVDKCPSTEQRIIRFVGEGQGKPGTTLFITCAGDAATN